MRGYERDEYEDWDEYEEDAEEQEEAEGGEDEIEETHQPTQAELEYLSLRQKLKESIRKEMKKELGTANSDSIKKTNTFRNDNFGSFFGPSQPVIAQRVIEESRSLLENPDLAARIAKSTHKNHKASGSAPARLKPQANHKSSVANGFKKKVEARKSTRDYSFLFSDDADVPASLKTPPPRNVSAPKSDARSAQLLTRNKPVVNDRGREHLGSRDGRKPMLASSHCKPKVELEKLARTGKPSVDPRKQLGSNNGSGPGRPIGPKIVPSKTSTHATGRVSDHVAKNTISAARKQSSSSSQPSARKPAPSNLQSVTRRPTPSNGQTSQLKRPLAHKEYQETSRPKVISKQAGPPSRDQLKRSPPRAPSRAPLRDERPKAKPKRQLRDEDSDGENAINMIRQMFGYNPNKFRDDDDVSDMEANFDDIMREEKHSAFIARKEDEEQLRLIEEEEERERMRLAKKRKLSSK